jgi:hypothetical protein
MTTFIWKAADASGKSVVREVTAGSVEESKQILLSEGLTNLELFQDEVMAAAVSGMNEAKAFGEEIKVTAEQRLEQVNKPPLTLWRAILQGLGQSKGFSVFLLALCLGLAYFGYTISAIIAGCAMLAWIAFIIFVSLPVIWHSKLHKALDWGRWDEATHLRAKLEMNNRISFIKIPGTEMVRTKAVILAGTGRLSEAISEFQQCENRPDCPGWLHKAYLAGICNTANAYDQALTYVRQSIQEKPTSTVYLDLANQLARYHGNAVEARQALAEAEKSTLPEITKAFQVRCRGIIAYVEGDYTSARQELESAIRLMEATPHIPGRDGNIRITKAYLCCVLAHLGDINSAKKYFAEAKAYLEATNETQLLAECNQALKSIS